MGTTINFPDHRPSYSRPKIQIVSHVRILAVPLSNINSNHSATVEIAEKIEACCLKEHEYQKHCFHA